MNLSVSKEQVLSFLNDEGLQYVEKPERGELQLNSPFVSDSKRRCGVNYKKNGTWNCFKSGNSGSWFEFVAQVRGTTTQEARLYFLKKYFNYESLYGSSQSVRHDYVEPKVVCEFPNGTERLNTASHPEYVKYLRSRHFSDTHLRELRLYVNTLQRRVLFPVYESGVLQFYAGRAIDSNNPLRWLNSGGNSHGAVWGLDHVGDEVWVFEGVFDAVRLYPRGVATFGNYLRESQLRKLLALNPIKFVVVGDGDDPGRFGQYRTATQLYEYHPNVWYHVWEPGSKDYSSMENLNPTLRKVDKHFKLHFNFNEATNFKSTT